MFLLIFIVLPLVEIFAFVEVGLAIGWLWALLLLFATSIIGFADRPQPGPHGPRASSRGHSPSAARRGPPRWTVRWARSAGCCC